MTHPLGETAEDAERWWRAYRLADCGRLDELHQRADRGSFHYPALHELAEWLAEHEHLAELRTLLVDHREPLAGWLARGAYPMRVVRLAAELGDDAARRRLQVWLSRLRERAAAGDQHARQFLAENPDWRRFRADWA